ncbi:MAG: rRNA maturation RNase YbeY [Methylococcales bacterium]
MILLDVQYASQVMEVPSKEQFRTWLNTVLVDQNYDVEVVIRITDEQEMSQLNHRYRQRQGTTNILSFPFEAPDQVPVDLLGDLVVCAPVVEQEAMQQGKDLNAHWAHMIIHGALHLLGYDHIKDSEAEAMENMEVDLLKSIGFPNPYDRVDLQ